MDKNDMDKSLSKMLAGISPDSESGENQVALINSIATMESDGKVGFKSHMFVWGFNPLGDIPRQKHIDMLEGACGDVYHEMNNMVHACDAPVKADVEAHPNMNLLSASIQMVIREMFTEGGIYETLGARLPANMADNMTSKQKSAELADRDQLAVYMNVHYDVELRRWYAGFCLLRQKMKHLQEDAYEIVETDELFGAEVALF